MLHTYCTCAISGVSRCRWKVGEGHETRKCRFVLDFSKLFPRLVGCVFLLAASSWFASWPIPAIKYAEINATMIPRKKQRFVPTIQSFTLFFIALQWFVNHGRENVHILLPT